MVYNLCESNSIIGNYVAEIRDIEWHNDRLRFRRNLERIAMLIGYEISKYLPKVDKTVQTPLGEANCKVLANQPVLATILRAGLPMHNGLLQVFDHAENAFISAYRKHDDKGGFEIELEYVSCPWIEDKILIIADPMLATGSSMILALKGLYQKGTPLQTHVVTAIACEPGIKALEEAFPDIYIWSADIDPSLSKKSYIVPGLGDAGDLAFGTKIQQ